MLKSALALSVVGSMLSFGATDGAQKVSWVDGAALSAVEAPSVTSRVEPSASRFGECTDCAWRSERMENPSGNMGTYGYWYCAYGPSYEYYLCTESPWGWTYDPVFGYGLISYCDADQQSESCHAEDPEPSMIGGDGRFVASAAVITDPSEGDIRGCGEVLLTRNYDQSRRDELRHATSALHF